MVEFQVSTESSRASTPCHARPHECVGVGREDEDTPRVGDAHSLPPITRRSGSSGIGIVLCLSHFLTSQLREMAKEPVLKYQQPDKKAGLIARLRSRTKRSSTGFGDKRDQTPSPPTGKSSPVNEFESETRIVTPSSTSSKPVSVKGRKRSKLPFREEVTLDRAPTAREAAFAGPPRYDWIDIVSDSSEPSSWHADQRPQSRDRHGRHHFTTIFVLCFFMSVYVHMSKYKHVRPLDFFLFPLMTRLS